PVRRRLSAALVLVAYLAAAVGFPVSAAPPKERDSTPAPARGRPCCCGSADACCCSVPEADGKAAEPDDPAEAPSPCCVGKETHGGVRWVVGLQALKCRGHATLWISAGTVLPP